MKFFICEDNNKFFQPPFSVKSYGKWHFFHDDKVKLYEGNGYIVLYCGYLIEGDIEGACERWSFDDENGNFFAIKLTESEFDISVDYFQNHKIFTASKYGQEISNYLPYMTIKEGDVCRSGLEYDQHAREFSEKQNTTFYDHINSYIPPYDYVGDCRRALEEEQWTDPEALAEYIHECMEQHSNLIKSRYENRFISLSEGMDSALQSQYFRDDPQYMYSIDLCYAGEDGKKYKDITAKNFSDVTNEVMTVDGFGWATRKFLKDSSTRWATILPTMKQIFESGDPDIVLYGVNGDEMFLRDLIPHMHLLMVSMKGEDNLKESLQKNLDKKKDHYGASYTLGDHKTPQTYIDAWMEKWITEDIDWDAAEYNMLKLLTPKLYTRAISANNDVIAASLYSDRRIYHEVFKTSMSFLLGNSMDSPIQRKILEKFNYTFITPHKDVLYCDYQGIFDNIEMATRRRDFEQLI